MSVLEDINQGKGYILGVLAFATAVGAFLTQVVKLRTEPTLIAVAGFALTILFVGWLVQRSENRQERAMKSHQAESMGMIECCKKDLDYLRKMALETQRSTLRIELCNTIARSPQNHDTILKMAEKYFTPEEQGGLGGNWYMGSVFCDWAEEEGVHLPTSLKWVQRER